MFFKGLEFFDLSGLRQGMTAACRKADRRRSNYGGFNHADTGSMSADERWGWKRLSVENPNAAGTQFDSLKS
jgi:hypothetical protein